MDERTSLSRRKAAAPHWPAPASSPRADLAWWDAPYIGPRKAWGAQPVRFQWSVPETDTHRADELAGRALQSSQKRISRADRIRAAAQARQKLISAIAGGSPPNLCRSGTTVATNGMGAAKTSTARAKSWKHYADVARRPGKPVTINNQISRFRVRDARRDLLPDRRLKELGLKEPTPDWTWDEFLAIAKAFTKADKNQYGYGLRGSGTWALLYPSEFALCNGAKC